MDRRAAASPAVPAGPRSGPCWDRAWSRATADRADARPAAAQRSRPAKGPDRSLGQPGQACRDPFDLFGGQLLTAADLVDNVLGSLAQEGLVAKLGRGGGQFLLGGGQVLL